MGLFFECLTVLLLPVYEQRLKWKYLEQKATPCWTEKTPEIFRDGFESVDCSIFMDFVEILNEDAIASQSSSGNV